MLNFKEAFKAFYETEKSRGNISNVNPDELFLEYEDAADRMAFYFGFIWNYYRRIR